MSDSKSNGHSDDLSDEPWAAQTESDRKFRSWLTIGTPEDWHICVQHWNWDNDDAPVRWIIRQMECDRSTAVLAFWLNDPSEVFGSLENYRDHSEGRTGDCRFQFCREILDRWGAGQYRRAQYHLELSAFSGFVSIFDQASATFPDRQKIWDVPAEFRTGHVGKTIARQPPWDFFP